MLKKTICAFAVMTITACSYFDQYNSKFATISTGDTDTKVLQIMGAPDSEKGVELLGAQAKHMEWKSIISNKTYTIEMMLGRVVGKGVF